MKQAYEKFAAWMLRHKVRQHLTGFVFMWVVMALFGIPGVRLWF